LVWARGVNHNPGLQAPKWIWHTGTAMILAALAAFTVAQVRRGKKAPLFFAAWFGILLAPVLPLRNHLSEYYLTLPTIGLAMLAGWALVSDWRSPPLRKAAAAALLLIYLSPLPVLYA